MRRSIAILIPLLGVAGCEPVNGDSPTSGYAAVQAGGYHTCGLLDDGTVWCWGSNDSGQLGDGGHVDQDQPVQVLMLSDVKAIATGHEFSCAVLQIGTAWCWGKNAAGQLGDGTTTARNTPGQIPGLGGLVGVTTGFQHACAWDQNGSAWCWGANDTGQLGIGNAAGPESCNTGGQPIACSLSPLPVEDLLDAEFLSAGGGEDGSHTCAIRRNRGAWCWGKNDQRQLGDGTLISRNSPVQVSLLGVVDVSAGAHHACGVTGDHEAYCWGEGFGDPFFISAISNVNEVAVGTAFACALLSSPAPQCWGANDTGQLGDGSTTARIMPVQPAGLFNALALAAGHEHACALVDDSTIWCWGSNSHGQLGGTTQLMSLTPVPVGR